MAFHELATNAVKHGALSIADGSVDIIWDCEAGTHGEEVRIRWCEHGVQIAGKPVGRGHGSEVLEKSIPQMLRGKFDRTFQPDGVDCLIAFPLHPA
jgi:two-component sensor histidine kinase